MNKRKRILYLIFGFILFNINKVGVFAKENLNYVKCGTARGIPRPVPQLTTLAYNLLIIATPLILVAFSIVTLIKAISSGKEEDITKAKGKLITKLIITALVFLTSFIVQFTVNRISSKTTDKNTFAKCTSCFLYYSTANCPVDEKGSGNDVTSNTTIPADPSRNRGNSNVVSNRTSNSQVSYGDFTAEEIDGLARFTMSKEGGLDSNGVPVYDNFGECYELSPYERSITIGAGGWMGQTGQKLLKSIRDKYPDVFNRLDTENIGYDLDHADWGNYCIKRNSAKMKAIISIITSEEGKKEQDLQIRQDMIDYIKEANERFDLHDKKAIAMYMNVRHIFGPNNLQARLFDKISKPYTYEKIYNFIVKDPNFTALPGYVNRYNDSKKWIEENM